MRLGRLVAGGLCLAGLGTGCSPSDAGPPAAPGLAIQVLQYRRDVADRAVQVKVQNLGDDAVRVDAVGLEAPGFTPVPRTPKHAVLAPGRRVDLRLPLGRTDCAITPSAGTPVVSLWLDGSDDAELHEVSDGRALVRVHDRECVEQAVREVLDVAFVPGAWERRGEGSSLVVHGVLRLEPRRGSAATLTGVEGTTLFAVSTATVVPAPVQGLLDVPVAVAPQRCDPHAVGESKRGYTFGVRVGVDGHEEVLLPIEPDAAARSMLEDALLEVCGLG